MRNLKKILALVLALVMSLSLMATAGAADFSDKDQISDKYSDAVTVLNGLEVFKGYDNGARFEPQGNITRAEVAAIIYRIATGDVTDTQKDIYSTWGLFTDVVDGSWYAGYVNYCANAGYIKGRGNKIFDPNGKVTGYEALAMILRAIGYDKNNEFSGSNWQVNTASIAKQRGITNNITDTLLGQAATREVVAEILFQAILVPTVTFNTATISYTNNATSLGKDVLNLDKVTGVVVANEYANVQDDDLKVLAEGKTQLRVAAGDVRTLDLGTDLNDIGMSENAYIQGSKVLLISEAENNVYDNTADNGKNVSIGSASDFRKLAGFEKNDETEYFVNFDHSTKNVANRRIELNVTFNSLSAENAFDSYAGTDISSLAVTNNYTVYQGTDTNANKVITLADNEYDYTAAAALATGSKGVYSYPVTYEMVFKAEEDELTSGDLSVLKGIFGMADDGDMTRWGVSGSVYVGTNSKDLVGNWNYAGDKSNEMSYKAFKAEYIDEKIEKNWSTANAGEWVKLIDNDGDGNAEYAFKTTFTLDKAVNTYTKDDESTLRYYSLDLLNDDDIEQHKYMNTVAEGDVVLYTVIDTKALVWKAETVEDTITKINDIYKRTITATTSSGDTYSQSEIANVTRLDQLLSQMSENVNYRLYLDAFGRVRAYEPVDGNKYALLTEMYYGTYQNNRYVVNDRLTVEMKAGDEGIVERVVNNPNSNDFLLNISGNISGTTLRNNWNDLNTVMTSLSDRGLVTDYETNLYTNIGLRTNWNEIVYNTTNSDWAKNVVLQPATANLGFPGRVYNAEAIFRNATTNIARYVVNADGTVALSTAAQSYNGNDSVTTNYVQLTGASVKKGQNVFNATGLPAGHNTHVDALSDTEFYIVSNSGVEHVVGYSNLPAVSDIRSMYAVARNTSVSTDKDKQNYWVAEVIVIEADNYAAQPDDYLIVLGRADYNSQVLSNDRQAVGTQNILAISAKQGGEIRITPTSYNWGTNTVTPGIYKAYGVAEVESGLYSVETLRPVDPRKVNNAQNSQSTNTNGFKLRAGTVTKLWDLEDRIEVNLNDGSTPIQLNLKGYALSVTEKSNRISIGHRMNGDFRSNLVKAGSNIIWVEDGSGNALFTIDVTYSLANSTVGNTIYNLLNDIYTGVIYSQNHKVEAGDYTVTVKYTTNNRNHTVDSKTYAVAARDTLVLKKSDIVPAGFGVTGDLQNATVTNTKNGLVTEPNNGCYKIWRDVNDQLTLQTITADLTVDVSLTVQSATVSTTAWGAGQVWVSGCDTAKTQVTNSQAVSSFHVGDTVKVELVASAANYGYEYTLKVVDKNGKVVLNTTSQNGVFSFVMPEGGVTLTPNFTIKSFVIGRLGSVNNVTWTINGTEITKDEDFRAAPDADFTFGLAAKPGYVLERVECNRGLSDNGNGTYTISKDVIGAGLVVGVTTVAAEYGLKIIAANGAPAVIYNGGYVSSSGTTVEKVTAGTEIRFTISDNTNAFSITPENCEYRTEKSGDTTIVVVTNFSADAKITVSGK